MGEGILIEGVSPQSPGVRDALVQLSIPRYGAEKAQISPQSRVAGATAQPYEQHGALLRPVVASRVPKQYLLLLH